MTKKQPYWQAVDSDDVIAFANASEPKLIWSIARAGDAFIFRADSLENTLRGRIAGWENQEDRQSNRLNDFAEIARLIEKHPNLWKLLPQELKSRIVHSN